MNRLRGLWVSDWASCVRLRWLAPSAAKQLCNVDHQPRVSPKLTLNNYLTVLLQQEKTSKQGCISLSLSGLPNGQSSGGNIFGTTGTSPTL